MRGVDTDCKVGSESKQTNKRFLTCFMYIYSITRSLASPFSKKLLALLPRSLITGCITIRANAWNGACNPHLQIVHTFSKDINYTLSKQMKTQKIKKKIFRKFSINMCHRQPRTQYSAHIQHLLPVSVANLHNKNIELLFPQHLGKARKLLSRT